MALIFIDQNQGEFTQDEMRRLAKLDDSAYRGSIPDIADGWFTEKDVEDYKELVSGIKGGVIIEVGSFEGLSLYHIKDICKSNNTRLISVDLFRWDKLVKNTKEWGIEFINLPSIEASKLFPNEYFDMVFLDARHSSRSVAKDVAAWVPKIKRNGLLAGHDFNLRKVRRGIAHVLDISKVCSGYDAVNWRNSSYVWWIKKPCECVRQVGLVQ